MISPIGRSTLSRSMIRALCYADVFDFPLKKEEMIKYQISTIKYHENSKLPIHYSKLIDGTDGYYFLKNRDSIISTRKQRTIYSEQKLRIARRIAPYLQFIPTIRMVAVTGAVAAGNAGENDDIDVLVVTKGGWLWTTRLLSLLLLDLIGKRRRPGDVQVKDKLCMNMFIDENHLQVPKEEQDVFSANEIARMKVVWSRNQADQKFYRENRWVLKYLQYCKPPVIVEQAGRDEKNVHQPARNASQRDAGGGGPLQFIELLTRVIQLQYMSLHRTNEVIRDGYLRFHPHDAREWIMRAYQIRLRKFGLG